MSGVTDEYGISQGSKTLSEAYSRPLIHCDGIYPTISSMVPSGETGSGTNIYTGAKTITLTFNEDVEKADGNIILRRAGNWALPSVLTVQEFNTICQNLTDAEQQVLCIKENGQDLEDSYWNGSSNANYASRTQNGLAYYHGKGQFVGPYKKSTQGILDDGKPDISTKYVLDFDMGIWETTTAHYYSKTFTSHTQTAPTTLNASNSTKITAADIRSVLETAHYHERILDVTSNYVSVSGNVVTLNFPKGLIDTSDDLPSGIEWELVIEPNCFMDKSGNYFEQDSTLSEVVIPTSNSKSTFMSDGVQTPVIRVDRYSYGRGIYQSDANGNKSSSIGDDNVAPTGYVRVRIDCQTPDVTIKYHKQNSSLDYLNSKTDTDSQGVESTYTESIAITKTTMNTWTINDSYTLNSIISGGTGSYTTGNRQYIVAEASNTALGSSRGYEGVFQTVVRIISPRSKSTTGTQVYTYSDDKDDFYIRGTTGWSGEPYISPFPLRDAQVGSPYMRLTYNPQNGNYYWISYEVLVDASFSGVAYEDSQWDYISGWGWVTPGGDCQATNMHTWY